MPLDLWSSLPLGAVVAARERDATVPEELPFRAELYSRERLVEHARALAAEHAVVPEFQRGQPLLPRLDDSARVLLRNYKQIAAAVRRNEAITPAAEWLLDNFHVVEEQLADIRKHLPRRYYAQLPKLAGGPLAGYPRVYALALDLIAHSDGCLDEESLRDFVRAYQEVAPLSTGELWAVAIMLRVGLAENLRRLTAPLEGQRRARVEADGWADRLIDTAINRPNDVVVVLGEMARRGPRLSRTYVVRLLQRLRGRGPAMAPVLEWIDRQLHEQGVSAEELIRLENQAQAADQISVSNTITSFRLLATIDWPEFFEDTSLVEAVLRQDPGGVYAGQDFDTRDACRHTVERLARGRRLRETEVAERAIRLAADAASDPDPRRRGVPYWLIDRGRLELEAALRYEPTFRERTYRWATAHPTGVYLGSIGVVTAVLMGLALWYAWRHAPVGPDGGRAIGLVALAGLLALIPGSDLALSIVNRVLTLLLPPRILPKRDYSKGIPEDFRTLVVIPALLTSAEAVDELLERLEVHYLANQDRNLHFALLSDFADSPTEEQPQDMDLLHRAIVGVLALNERHEGPNVYGRFFLFHRPRLWNPSQNCWMGWERKRGKLVELNRLLRGAHDTSYAINIGDPSALEGTRFVICLDTDTQLPPEAARKLVGTLAHPLNRPVIDPKVRRVVEGYGILQPRVSIALVSAGRSLFTRVFSGNAGVDPYTTAVSDVYQDLFGEGIFCGKGIYDVDAFEASLEGRVGDNVLLSHDLFEGNFARCGLVSDIELFDDYPARYNTYSARQHRWVRGDWQLLRWIMPRVRQAPEGKLPVVSGQWPVGEEGAGGGDGAAAGGSQTGPTSPTRPTSELTTDHWPLTTNPLSLIGRWKIVDNLRRSLVAPALLLMLAAGWLVLPGRPAVWTLLGLLVSAFPIYAHLANALFIDPRGVPWTSYFWGMWYDTLTNLYQVAISVTFLAHQAYVMVDAILRTLWRMFVSRRSLLEWTTAADMERRMGTGLGGFWRRMAFAPAAGAGLLGAVALWRPGALPEATPFCIAWILSPMAAWWVSRPLHVTPIRRSAPVTDGERRMLRLVARRTWRFFQDFVTEADHWLPPDNYQEDPAPRITHRTSPTNVGLLLLSTVSARDLGYVGLLELADRLERTLWNVAALERYRGHLYNWYDTLEAKAIPPFYISSVDSGNLAGCLVALKQACAEIGETPVFGRTTLRGLDDTLRALRTELPRLPGANVEQEVEALERVLQADSSPITPLDWLTRLDTIETAFQALDARLQQSVGPEPPKPPPDDLGAATREALLATSSNGTGEPASTGSITAWQPSAPDEVRAWLALLRSELGEARRDLAILLPWARLIRVQPPPFGDGKPLEGPLQGRPYVFRDLVRNPISFGDLPELMNEALGELEQLSGEVGKWGNGEIGDGQGPALSGPGSPSPDTGAAQLWLQEVRAAFEASRSEATTVLQRFHALGELANRLFVGMEFGFLYDEARDLFAVGYDAGEGRLDRYHYDLLASECRLASFVAIAKRDVPQKHWFRMGRALTTGGHNRALVSWSGTMFEYMMPLLVMRAYEGTLLAQTLPGVVRQQIRFGRRERVPWGFSESGFNARDPAMNYQYRAFGVPGLGLKPDLSDDLVVAPYATVLALPIAPKEAVQNLQALEREGLACRYGFYEAIDYTPERVPQGQKGEIVHSLMAHHQGMSLVSIANYLLNNPMPERFHADPMVKAVDLLLQERNPREAVAAHPHTQEVLAAQNVERPVHAPTRHYMTPYTSTPRAQLLSNGRYSVMVTVAGGSASSWNGLAVTRWREDVTRDHWGMFFYVRDLRSGETWSAAHQPLGGTPGEYEVDFSEDKVEFRRRVSGIVSHLEIAVSAEDDAEVRRLTLTNRTDYHRDLEVTSYAEVVLASAAADLAHPAFSNLFVETEFVEGWAAVLASRRPRAHGQPRYWAAHVLSQVGAEGPTEGPTGAPRTQYETDRNRFLGRGRTPANPIALEQEELSNFTGAVLDPIFSLRRRVRLRPNETVQLTFTTAAAESREAALRLAERYHDPRAVGRAFELAWTHSQVQLRHLNLTPDEAQLCQRLASRVLYVDSFVRPTGEVLAYNTQGQSGLWAYGISGDLPIVLAMVSSAEHMDLVRQLLVAHEYLRMKGLAFDLVILNDHAASYVQAFEQQLQDAARNEGAQLDRPGGVFLRRTELIPDAGRNLLLFVARAVFDGDGGPLAEQLDWRPEPKEAPVEFKATRSPLAPRPVPVREPDLIFENGYGGFTADGREYVITLSEDRWTPAPWINVIANERFGFLATEAGCGYSWSENSRENKLTPWSNDPVSDRPGEAIYLRHEDTGRIWSIAPLPIREPTPYVIRHGAGYTRYHHGGHGLEQELLVFCPPDEPVKIYRLRLKNVTDRPQKLSATFYTEWVLGVAREQTHPYVATSLDGDTGALLARNTYNNEFGHRIAFVDVNQPQRSWTADRTEFLGRNGSPQRPRGLRRVELGAASGAELDPCAAVQVKFVLQPAQREKGRGDERTNGREDEWTRGRGDDPHSSTPPVVHSSTPDATGRSPDEREMIFVLGQGNDIEEVRTLVRRYRNAEEVEQSFQAARERWETVLGVVQVKTPDGALDLLLNRWLVTQTLSCRIWARSAFYQSGGAFGFRDQLQDCMAMVFSSPSITRAQILLHASRQFVEGDVQHWWHPPTGRGIRTRFSDDLLFLPYVTAYYVRCTGDDSILNERVHFLHGRPLNEGEDEYYDLPTVTEEEGTIYEHCLRAIHRGLTRGAHGLPLMGCGDWNDGMNRVGHEGKGESVWVAWFLCAVLRDFLPLCEARGDRERAEEFRGEIDRLKEAIETHAWDGDWYRRAYFDDGTPLGSKENDECQIDAIAQSWSVISGAGDPERSRRAMESVEERLVREKEGLILLFTPAFDESHLDPGYIKGYVPGVRENGGQYTHAALWTVLATALLGQGTRAHQLYTMINPVHHGVDPANPQDTRRADHYKGEPYVVAADVYGVPPWVGRGGWTWYTGSSGWMYRVGLEAILGFHLHGSHFEVNPCIPAAWHGFEITYRHGSSTYHITVENPAEVERGVVAVTLDGHPLPERRVPLADDGAEHHVRVVMG